MKPRKRRGLSSIVGALFFIILMVGTFTTLLAAFSYQNSLIDTQNKLAQQEVARASEKFFVTANETAGSKLFVTVKNQGTNPVEIANLWVIEKDTPEKKATLYPLSFVNSTIPVSFSKNVTDGSITLSPSNHYTVKLVSRLGSIVTSDVPDTTIPPGPAGASGAQGQACWDLNSNGAPDMVLSPPVVIGGITYTTEDRDGSGAVNILDCQGTGAGPPGPAGQACWDLNNDGVGTLTNPDEDKNNDGLVNVTDCAGNAEDVTVLFEDLLNRPEIFMIFPSPFGLASTSTTGTWGVTIANPNTRDMTVNKIVITTLLPLEASGRTVFPPNGVFGNWVSQGNQLTWQATPVTITSKSATSFLVSVPQASPGITANENGIPVFASVLTTYGQFGKTSYLSSMIKPSGSIEAPVVNVYRSDVKDSTTNVKSTFNIPSNQPFTTFVTISENATSSPLAYVKSGTQLIVNLPKQFTNISADGQGVFTITPIVQNNVGYTQVIATLNAGQNVGDAGHPNARSFSITATAPDLTGQTDPKLYVMYILGDGKATYSGAATDWQIGPLDEVIVKVTP